MNYINEMLNSLSAITLSETGKAVLKVDNRQSLSYFTADLDEVDDILNNKAGEALRVLRGCRPQFQHDHRAGGVQPPYVRDLIDYLVKTVNVFEIIAFVFSKCKVADESWGDNCRRVNLSAAYAKTFRTIAEEYLTYYGEAIKTDGNGQNKGKGRIQETFASCVVDKSKTEDIWRKIITRLNARGRGGKQAAIIVLAAESLGWIRRPNSGIMKREFEMKDVSGYNFFIKAYRSDGKGRITRENIESEKKSILAI